MTENILSFSRTAAPWVLVGLCMDKMESEGRGNEI